MCVCVREEGEEDGCIASQNFDPSLMCTRTHHPSRIANLFRANLLTSARYSPVRRRRAFTHLFIIVRARLIARRD